jgi:hypothetical protein
MPVVEDTKKMPGWLPVDQPRAPVPASVVVQLEAARHKKLVALWGIDVLRKTNICVVDDDAIQNVTMGNALANLLAEIVGEATSTIQRLEDKKLHATSYVAALLGAAVLKDKNLSS